MSNIDVLLITALKEEHDAARDAASATSADAFGVTAWEERDATTAAPYLLGKYVAAGGRSMNIALARSTRMGSTATSPVVASLVERLKPRCLAMCGVCAGNPGDVALGDVIIAEMVYSYDEGKRKTETFEGDHRQTPMVDAWVRAAQDLRPDGLPSFGPASDEESTGWLLERLYAGDDPKKHPARKRYFPRGIWAERLRTLQSERLVRIDGMKITLSQRGRSVVEKTLAYDVDGPQKLPFEIKVGPIASGNVVVKDGVTWDNLKMWGVRSVLGLEMEAATIGSTAHRLGVPYWVVAKGVMDHADPQKGDRYKLFAARASAEVLFKFLLMQVASSTSKNIGTEERSSQEGSREQSGAIELESDIVAIICANRTQIIVSAANIKQEAALVAMRSIREIKNTFSAVYNDRRQDPSYPSLATIECAHTAAFTVMRKTPALLAAFDTEVRQIVEQSFYIGYICGVYRRPFFDIAPVKRRPPMNGEKLWSTLDRVLADVRDERPASGSVEAGDVARIIVGVVCERPGLDGLHEPMVSAAYLGVSVAVAEEILRVKTNK